jgi:predicted RNase H-like HicB family nuclease
MKVSAVIERDADGYFAYCPELKGCYTQGATLDEVLARLREAVDLYVDTLSADERAALSTSDVVTTTIDVRVA